MLRRHFYFAAIAAAGSAGACRPSAAPVPREAFAPSDRAAFEAAAARTTPTRRELLRIRWHSEDGRISVSGTGAVRLAPPDSVRVDLAVRLGVARGTLIVAGDSVWAEPREVTGQFLEGRFALWAALGVIRVPDGVRAFAVLEDGRRTFWRVTDGGGLTTTFELRDDTLFAVTRERAGATMSQLQLARGPDGAVTLARVTDYERQARFEVQISSRQPSEAFPSDVWHLRS